METTTQTKGSTGMTYRDLMIDLTSYLRDGNERAIRLTIREMASRKRISQRELVAGLSAGI